MLFDVSYEIITQESAEHGDRDECGYIAEGVGLREAIRLVFGVRTSHVGEVTGVENHDSWFTVYNGMEFLTGAHESRSLHLPDNLTAASARRIWRLINA